MSQQNPIHRDGGRRDGQQPFQDNKEALSQSQAEIEQSAPLPEDEPASLTDEQRDALRKHSVNERLAKVQEDVANEE